MYERKAKIINGNFKADDGTEILIRNSILQCDDKYSDFVKENLEEYLFPEVLKSSKKSSEE